MGPERLIAVFDSGLGGISVLRELVRQMPHEQFLYFGDSANAPYGSRSTAEVRAMTLERISALMERNLKAVVVACNTATSAAIDELRRQYPDTVIVGIEPALKLAAEHCPQGRIIVMATKVTLREEKFARLLAQYGASRDIVPLPCPELVSFVEKGLLDGPEVEDYLRTLLPPELCAGAGAIVLGCTHFPFLTPVIGRIVGPEVRFFDGAGGTSAQTRRLLAARDELRTAGELRVILENSLGTPEILELSARLLDYDS